jgi:hypothetical protein
VYGPAPHKPANGGPFSQLCGIKRRMLINEGPVDITWVTGSAELSRVGAEDLAADVPTSTNSLCHNKRQPSSEDGP